MLEQLLSNFVKCDFNVGPLECRRLFIWDIVVFSQPLLNSLLSHLAFIYLIDLVTEYEEREVIRIFWVSFDQEVLLPHIQVFEAALICDIVDQDACFCAPIESDSQTLVPLLASCVPDLKTITHPITLLEE